MLFRVPLDRLEKCPFVIGVSADVELDFVDFVLKRGSKHREIRGLKTSNDQKKMIGG